MIRINNNSYVGNSVIITNGKVIIDGKDVTPDYKEININVTANINELRVDSCNKIQVEGSIKTIQTKSGDVEVTGDVDGSISTMSGDVECNMVQGSVSTMSGNIKYRK